MPFSLIDFFIGFFLMNAMPHMLFGLIRLRFLSAFGFSAPANIAYAFLNVIIAGLLYNYQYGIKTLIDDGIVLGALTMILIYLITGRFLANLFQEN